MSTIAQAHQKYVTTFTEVDIRYRVPPLFIKDFLLLIKRLLLGDAPATITDTLEPFCSDKNLVLSKSQHLSQDLHLIPAYFVQITATD